MEDRQKIIENLLKIKAAYPELSGTLSDFSSMTQ